MSIAEIAGRHDTATGYLRPAEQADSLWMHSLLQNEEYAFFAVRREHSVAEIASDVRDDIGSPVTALFIIMQEDEQAGWVRVERDTENQLGTLSYGVTRDMWGRCHASSAVQVLTSLCFSRTDIMKLCARVDARNSRSASVLQKSGFVTEGRLVSHFVRRGERVDKLLFGLTRDSWARQEGR